MRRLGAIVAVVLVALIPALPARAQYPPQPPTCQVNDSTVAPGQTVQVSGQNWQENSSVQIRFRQPDDDQIYGPFPTNAQGSFSASVTIPSDAEDGPARLVVGGNDQAGQRTICRIEVTVDSGGGEPTPGAPTCEFSDINPEPAQTHAASGRHWLELSQVAIRFKQGSTNELLATATVNGAGRFNKSVSIPPDAQPGPAEIEYTGRDSNGDPAVCTVDITVHPHSQPASLTVVGPLTPGTLALLLGTVMVVFVGARRRSRGLLRRA